MEREEDGHSTAGPHETRIQDLPDDTLAEILRRVGEAKLPAKNIRPHLPVKNPLHCALVCKRWRAVTDSAVRALDLRGIVLSEGPTKELRSRFSNLAEFTFQPTRRAGPSGPLAGLEHLLLPPHGRGLETLEIAHASLPAVAPLLRLGRTTLRTLALSFDWVLYSKADLHDWLEALGELRNLTRLSLEFFERQFPAQDFPTVCAKIDTMTTLSELNLVSNWVPLPNSMSSSSGSPFSSPRAGSSRLPNILRSLEIRHTDIAGGAQPPESLSRFSHLTRLVFSHIDEPFSLPDAVGHIRGLRELIITDCWEFEGLPESIGNLHATLEKLELDDCPDLPASLPCLTNLHTLHLSSQTMQQLPESVGALTRLTELQIRAESLDTLPESIGQLTRLVSCMLDVAQTRSLPHGIGGWCALEKLRLWCNALIPASVGGWKRLRHCELHLVGAERLPESVGDWCSLEQLTLHSDLLSLLPASVGSWTRLAHCQLHLVGVESLPETIGNWQSLEKLTMKCNSLSLLPHSVGQWTRLTHCQLHLDWVKSLPSSVGKWESLQGMTVQCQALTVLPESLCQLSRLQDLALIGCRRLRSLPRNFIDLSALKRMRVIDCPSLISMPEDLGGMSSLEKLRVVGCRSLKKLPRGVQQRLPRGLTRLQCPISICPFALRPTIAASDTASSLNAVWYEDLSESFGTEKHEEDDTSSEESEQWGGLGDVVSKLKVRAVMSTM